MFFQSLLIVENKSPSLPCFAQLGRFSVSLRAAVETGLPKATKNPSLTGPVATYSGGFGKALSESRSERFKNLRMRTTHGLAVVESASAGLRF